MGIKYLCHGIVVRIVSSYMGNAQDQAQNHVQKSFWPLGHALLNLTQSLACEPEGSSRWSVLTEYVNYLVLMLYFIEKIV